ncbi:hypothetical protein [Antribacter soli]|nr:hypothetical protein [Antribacter soli]
MMVLGVVLVAAGVLLFVGGLVAVVGTFASAVSDSASASFADSSGRLMQQTLVLFGGILVLTAGRVFVRGARRRGLRDRFGRLVMLAALALVGIGLATLVTGWESVVAGMEDVFAGRAPIDSITEDDMFSDIGTILLPTAGWMLAGAVLDLIGRRLADEPDPLITVSMTADF